MNQPTWQKARITSEDPTDDTTGKELWVKGRPFEAGAGILESTGNFCPPGIKFYTNLRDCHNHEIRILAEAIELLPEFADDVPMVPWGEFIRG